MATSPSLSLPTNAGAAFAPATTARVGNFGTPLVPTKAPAAPAAVAPTNPVTPTPPPVVKPSTPVPVVSSGTATDHITNTIVPAMQQGQTAIATQNANTTLAQDQAKAANQGKPGYDVLGNPITPTPPPSASDQAAHDVANTPDNGFQFVYGPNGSRISVPVGQVPNGYSSTNPTVAPSTPILSSATMSTGTVVNQYNNGTYGFIGPDGKYQGTANSQDFQDAQNASSLKNNLVQLVNGTYPLTSTQQAQVDGMKAQFDILIQQQQVANANFTGGTTVAENLYGMGNSLTGLGQIKGSIDAGIAKVADLNGKMVAAVAQMTQAFQDQNLKMLSAAYDIFNNTMKDRQAELDKMHAETTAAAQDARDYNNKVQQQQIQEANNTRQYNLEIQKEQDQLNQNKITNAREDALAKSTILKHTIENKKTLQDIQQFNNTQVALKDLGGNTVLNVNGAIDPAKQAQYLATIAKQNPGLALTIKAAAEYRLPLTARFFMTKAGMAFSEQMLQYDPTWDSKNYASRQATVTNFASGKYSTNVNALNTAAGHIATLASDMDKLGNVNFSPANFVKNTVGPFFGYNPQSGAKLDIAAVTGELASSFKATGATDQEIKALSTIDANATPADIQAYVSSATHLMATKLGALEDTYTTGVGKPPAQPFLHPQTVAALSALKNSGYDIQIPGVGYTDVGAYLKNDTNASQNMDTAKQRLQAAGMDVTSENILQLAQQLQ